MKMERETVRRKLTQTAASLLGEFSNQSVIDARLL